jgi:hypothetical protein
LAGKKRVCHSGRSYCGLWDLLLLKKNTLSMDWIVPTSNIAEIYSSAQRFVIILSVMARYLDNIGLIQQNIFVLPIATDVIPQILIPKLKESK